MEKKYKIKYLPAFYKDLAEITNYISKKLLNNIAAHHFLDEVEKEIHKRQLTPESTAKFISGKDRKKYLLQNTCKELYYILHS